MFTEGCWLLSFYHLSQSPDVNLHSTAITAAALLQQGPQVENPSWPTDRLLVLAQATKLASQQEKDSV